MGQVCDQRMTGRAVALGQQARKECKCKKEWEAVHLRERSHHDRAHPIIDATMVGRLPRVSARCPPTTEATTVPNP
jgi:hypothetical protein